MIKHSGSRNPISRRTGHHITISKEQAIEELNKIKAEITTENFASQAKARSDCGSFANGGDLGFFKRGDMQKPFEEAAFNLKIGEISGIVDTDSGVHLVYRTG